MNYIITKNKAYFEKIGKYKYCNLQDMILPDTIAVDTETTGLFAKDCDFTCVQIGTGVHNYIIHMYDNNYTFDDLAPYLDDKELVFHNAQFDLGFMYKYNYFPMYVRDTMLASKILYNGQMEIIGNDYNDDPIYSIFQHGFGYCMKRELGIVYDKTDQKNIHLVKLSQESTIKYSFNDVDKLLDLHNALCKKIDAGGFRETYDLHCQYARVLAYMEQCGMPIDSELWQAKMAQDIADAAKWKGVIQEYIYDNLPKFANYQIDMFDTKKRITVSIDSPKQMVKVFNAFGIATKDKDDKDSINENIISKSKHPFVEMWLGYQKANHRVTTFGVTIFNRIIDGRVYTNFNPMVDTARLSCRRGSINFLNFPSDKATRYCFVAKPGHRMIVCDWSGQETVIAADMSGDEAMTKSVLEGADLHCLLARILFPELEELTDEQIIADHKDKRQDSKAPRFAMQYGGNAYTLHINEGIPMDRASEIEAGFKLLHQGLYTWGNSVFMDAVMKGYIESVDGWKLKLPKYDIYIKSEAEIKSISKEEWVMYSEGKKEYKALKEDEKYEVKNEKNLKFYRGKVRKVSNFFKLKSEYQRLCLNSPVQTCGAHMLKRASVILFDWIIRNNYQWKILLCNEIHDEIVLEAINELAEIAKKALQSAMIEGGNHYLDDLTIKADASIGNSWGEAK